MLKWPEQRGTAGSYISPNCSWFTYLLILLVTALHTETTASKCPIFPAKKKKKLHIYRNLWPTKVVRQAVSFKINMSRDWVLTSEENITLNDTEKLQAEQKYDRLLTNNTRKWTNFEWQLPALIKDLQGSKTLAETASRLHVTDTSPAPIPSPFSGPIVHTSAGTQNTPQLHRQCSIIHLLVLMGVSVGTLHKSRKL